MKIYMKKILQIKKYYVKVEAGNSAGFGIASAVKKKKIK